MSRIIAVANQKGGVGKTTTAINLTASLARARRRTLLIDLDPQANATSGLGVMPASVNVGIYEVLIGLESFDKSLTRLDAGFDAVFSNKSLFGAQVELLNMDQREHRLRISIGDSRDKYDYVIIDCPPVLNILTLNALSCADSVLVPVQCEFFALQGLLELFDTVRRVQKSWNEKLEIEGILRTMYDQRNKLSKEVSDKLVEFFEEHLFRTIIPRNVRLAEAPSHGLSVIEYDKNCTGTTAYIALTGELLSKEKR